jgi:hypothetical protein
MWPQDGTIIGWHGCLLIGLRQRPTEVVAVEASSSGRMKIDGYAPPALTFCDDLVMKHQILNAHITESFDGGGTAASAIFLPQSTTEPFAGRRPLGRSRILPRVR